jgi:hypothetical protein
MAGAISMSQRVVTDIAELLRPRTPKEREAGLRALALVQQHAEARAAARGGRPLSPSWTELIEEMRREEDGDDVFDSDQT